MSGIRDTDDLEYYSYKQLTKLFGSNQLKDPAVNTSSSSSSSSEHSSDDSDDSSSNNNSKYSSTFDRKNRKDIIIKTSSTEHDNQPAAELKYRMNDQSVVSAAAISYNNVIDDTKNTTNVTIDLRPVSPLRTLYFCDESVVTCNCVVVTHVAFRCSLFRYFCPLSLVLQIREATKVQSFRLITIMKQEPD